MENLVLPIGICISLAYYSSVSSRHSLTISPSFVPIKNKHCQCLLSMCAVWVIDRCARSGAEENGARNTLKNLTLNKLALIFLIGAQKLKRALHCPTVGSCYFPLIIFCLRNILDSIMLFQSIF